jgi:hypothetical protein
LAVLAVTTLLPVDGTLGLFGDVEACHMQLVPAEADQVIVTSLPTVIVLALAEIVAVIGATPDNGTW